MKMVLNSMKARRVVLAALFLICATVSAVPALRGVSDYAEHAFAPGPYGWQDEGYVLEPALQVYQGGYSAFRCRSGIVVCYGSTQAFLDGLLLRLLPNEWVEDGALLEQPGRRWYYMSAYPEAFRILRMSRLGYLLALFSFAYFLARRSGWGRLGSVAYIGGFASTLAFVHSRQGLKNDYIAALACGMFVVFAVRTLLRSERQKGAMGALAVVCFGTFVAGIKVSLFVPVVLFLFFWLGLRWRQAVPIVRIFRELLLLWAGMGGTYFALNPNFWMSSSEATWFRSFFISSNKPLDLLSAGAEFMKLGFESTWPLFLASALALIRWKRLLFPARIATLYVLSCGALVLALTLKSQMGRAHYYLFPSSWAFFSLLALAPLLIFGGRARTVFQLIVASISAFIAIQSNSWSEKSFSFPRWGGARDAYTAKLNGLIGQQKKLVVDLMTRPAIEKSVADGAEIVFFDSLSEPPQAVFLRAFERWGKLPAWDEIPVVAGCWDRPERQDLPALQSPAALAWIQFLGDRCAERVPLSIRTVFAFENGGRVSSYASLRLEELPRSSDLLQAPQHGLSPRFLRGAIHGMDYWYSPLTLEKSGVLEGEFLWPEGLERLTGEIESVCKGQGRVTIQVEKGDVLRAEQSLSLDVRERTCAESPCVCRLGFLDWWRKRYPVSFELKSLGIGQGKTARIRLRFEGLSENKCIASIGLFRIETLRDK